MSESQPAQSLANARRTVISKRTAPTYGTSLANRKRIHASVLTTPEENESQQEWDE